MNYFRCYIKFTLSKFLFFYIVKVLAGCYGENALNGLNQAIVDETFGVGVFDLFGNYIELYNQMTFAACVGFCRAMGFRYAGIQDS